MHRHRQFLWEKKSPLEFRRADSQATQELSSAELLVLTNVAKFLLHSTMTGYMYLSKLFSMHFLRVLGLCV